MNAEQQRLTYLRPSWSIDKGVRGKESSAKRWSIQVIHETLHRPFFGRLRSGIGLLGGITNQDARIPSPSARKCKMQYSSTSTNATKKWLSEVKSAAFELLQVPLPTGIRHFCEIWSVLRGRVSRRLIPCGQNKYPPSPTSPVAMSTTGTRCRHRKHSVAIERPEGALPILCVRQCSSLNHGSKPR